MREFLHVDDLADAVTFLINKKLSIYTILDMVLTFQYLIYLLVKEIALKAKYGINQT